jgi:hypothetical protein
VRGRERLQPLRCGERETQAKRIVRIYPATGGRQATIAVAGHPFALAAGAGAIWAGDLMEASSGSIRGRIAPAWPGA